MSNETEAQKALSLLYLESNRAKTILKMERLMQKIGLKKYDNAMKQYFSTWDDSIRQGLVSIAFQAVGGEHRGAIPLQVALTFIDATMDIHDDIIDESLKKKRTKTLYGKLGRPPTLLLGDLMLVKGFHLLSGVIRNLPLEKQSQIMDTINSFLSEVVKAHISEANLKIEKWKVNPWTYMNILRQKAAEVEGRMKIAGICGGGTEKEIDSLGNYGRYLGTLLAVRAEFTDLFDIMELSNRVKNECLPLHILFALQNKGCKEEVYALLSKPYFTMKDMQRLMQLIYETNCLSRLNRELLKIQKQSINEIFHLKKGKATESLKLIAISILEDM